jgi:hypothetical protein
MKLLSREFGPIDSRRENGQPSSYLFALTDDVASPI